MPLTINNLEERMPEQSKEQQIFNQDMTFLNLL